MNSNIMPKRLLAASFLMLIICLCTFNYSYGADVGQELKERINISFGKETLGQALVKFSKSIKTTIAYDGHYLQVNKYGIEPRVFTDVRAEDVLTYLLAKTPISYKISTAGIVLQKVNRSHSASGSNQPGHGIITGRITTQEGQPLPGATIEVVETGAQFSSDHHGAYKIQLPGGSYTLSVHYVSYTTQKQQVTVLSDAHAEQNFVLEVLSDHLEEVVVVGYGTQKRASLTGAVSDIKSEEILQTKNENVLNALSGRIPGIRVRQMDSEPGVFGSSMDIRGLGSPLVVIDGVPREDIVKLNPNDIESISVLKDASAAIYGVKAANGVVLVTTKGGKQDNSFDMDYNGSILWQMPSGMPKTVGAVDYMLLANELDMNQLNGAGTWRYSQDMIDAFRSGERQSSDWNKATMKSSAPQGQHNLSFSGGNERSRFYSSIGYQYQESFFNSKKGFDYNKFNIRANMNSKLSDQLTFDLKIGAFTDERNRTQFESNEIIRAAWRQVAIDPIYANNVAPYYYHTTISESNNPVAWIDRDYVGYKQFGTKAFQSSGALTYAVKQVEGLSVEAFYSYDYTMNGIKDYARAYEQYRYDEENGIYDKFILQTPSSIRRDFNEEKSTMYRFSVKYDNLFADDHRVSALFLQEGRKLSGDGFYASRQLSLDIDELFAGDAGNQIGSMDPDLRYEFANESFVGRINYAYKDKYLLEGAFRLDGSSRFPKDSRWGFFPAASVGYRLSEENFWQDSFLKSINEFKVRGSYGLLGDDSGINYQFITGYNYPSSAAFLGGKYVNGVSSTGIPNPHITWYKSETFNIGFDMELLERRLGITFDAFRRNRTGLLASRAQSIPGTIGAEFPLENLNSDRNEGYELALSYRGTHNQLQYSLGGNISLTRHKDIDVERPNDRSAYHNWRNNPQNRYSNIWWGIEKGGQYGSFDEIAEFPVYAGRNELPGNYYHQDWNGDGVIDDMDKHPLGFGTAPLMNYGISASLSYKGIDFFMLWQGASLSNVYYTEILHHPLHSGYDNTLDRFLDRWRPVDPSAEPYDQKTEFISGKYPMPGSSYPGEESEFSVYRNQYIRLKNVEVGYTLPENWLQWAKIKHARVSAGGYNLLTFSPVSFVDPEHPQDKGGYMYPLNKTFNFSLSFKF